MGNQKSLPPQEWNQNYKIIQSQEQNESYRLLEDVVTGERYINKTLASNDQDDAEQLNQMIHEKLKDPSPFLNKLLKSRFQVQENYCSTKRNFHLLFELPDRLLSHQISERRNRKIGFNDQQINLVIDNASKGLLYLHKINQPHRSVSSSSITWPVNQQSTVQLVDSWSLNEPATRKTRKQKSRNNESTQEQNDLYSLGLTVLDMLYEDEEKYSLSISNKANKINDESVRKKLWILLSEIPRQRHKIYNIIDKETASKLYLSTKDSEKRKLQTIQSPPQIPIQHHHVSIVHQHPPQIQPAHRQVIHPPQINSVKQNQVTFGQPNMAQSVYHQPPPSFSRNTVMNNSQLVKSSSINTPIGYLTNRNSMNTVQNNPSPIKVSFGGDKNVPTFQSNTNTNFQPSYASIPKTDFTLPTISPPKPYNPANLEFTSSNNSGGNLYTSSDFFKKIDSSSSLTFNKVEQPKKQIENNHENQNVSSIAQIVEEENPKSTESPQQNSPQKINTLQTPSRNHNIHQERKISTIHERSQFSASSDEQANPKEQIIEYYDTGSRYEGEKRNGMRNGHGKFYYQEGSYYDGQWKDNKMHGQGKLYYSNGALAYEGQWYMDEFHGLGKVYNDNCLITDGMFDYTDFNNLDEQWKYYEGSLVSDSKEGYGKIVLGNGEYYEGNFSGDRLNGEGQFTRKDGEVIHGIWKESILQKVL